MNIRPRPVSQIVDPKRGEIWQADFDPSRGSEIKKVRPCMVVGRDDIGVLPVRVVVPITDWKGQYERYPWMIKLTPTSSNGLNKPSALDCLQVRCMTLERFSRRRGHITAAEVASAATVLAQVVGFIK